MWLMAKCTFCLLKIVYLAIEEFPLIQMIWNSLFTDCLKHFNWLECNAETCFTDGVLSPSLSMFTDKTPLSA